jgi:hypothetical protein
MSNRVPAISTQEARLRLSLGIRSGRERPSDDELLPLHNAYRKIFKDAFLSLAGYESGLNDLCSAMRRINSVNPFLNDEKGLALQAEAVRRANSLLLSHGLPFPLPTSGSGLDKLKKEWPSIRARRRRIIRVEQCKKYSLPLNSSWEKINECKAPAKKPITPALIGSRRYKFSNPPITIIDIKLALRKRITERMNSQQLRELRDELQTAITYSRKKHSEHDKVGEVSQGRIVLTRSQSEALEVNLRLCDQCLKEVSEREQGRGGIAPFLKRQTGTEDASHADNDLLESLIAGIGEGSNSKGYVYLKRWCMGDGRSWYKIGITNNPERRDAEQNVLPVPAETIACIEVESIERARSIEARIHRSLAPYRIREAKNRELFHLTPSQLSALEQAFDHYASS